MQKRNLSVAETQVANLMAAIKAGIITPSTKNELEKAEECCEKAKAAMEATTSISQIMDNVLPNAAERYRKLVANLGQNLRTDINYARECLKTLLGQIKLVPSTTGSFLNAELNHNPEGLMELALTNEFKARLVAGARFELTTFRL